ARPESCGSSKSSRFPTRVSQFAVSSLAALARDATVIFSASLIDTFGLHPNCSFAFLLLNRCPFHIDPKSYGENTTGKCPFVRFVYQTLHFDSTFKSGYGIRTMGEGVTSRS